MKSKDLFKVKIYSIIACFLLVFLINVGGVKAYEFPSNSFYFNYVDESLGEIQIYFPSNQIQYLSYQEGYKTIINTSSSTVYGYFNYQNESFRYSFTPYSVATVRINALTYEMNITELLSTNINFLDDSTIQLSNDTFRNINQFYIICLGGIAICLIWLKR